jgi:uncharacterized protein (DUF885 family)
MNTSKLSFFSILIFCILLFIGSSCSSSGGEGVKSLEDIIEEEAKYAKDRKDSTKENWTTDLDSLDADIDQLEQQLSDLENIDVNSLSESELINYDLISLVLEDRLANLNNKSYLMPLSSEGGFITGIIYALQRIKLDSEEQRIAYKKKLTNLPEYLAKQKAILQTGIESEITIPRIIVEQCNKLLQGNLELDPKESFLSKPLASLDDEENFKETCEKIIEEDVLPSMQDFSKFLTEEYIPKTRKSIGVSENKNGKAYYEQRVKYYTTLDMTPEQVFETGVSEVKRIRSEMETIISDLEYQGSFEEFLTFLRTDPQFYAKTPEQILHHAAWLSKKAEEFLPKYFGKLPRLPFTVSPVPEAIAPNYTAGRYSPGSYKDHRAGQYWVNTLYLESRPLYALPALTLHEAVPGHHLQGSLAAEIEDVPSIRNETYLSAYGEGWGLYSEFLGKEAGFYKTPYEDFGRLTYEMWRACRLVVDPGIHYMGWSRQEAVDFMASNTALSMHEVNTEIDRYIGWPGQAVSYKIGELKIRELRKKAEEKLGEKFDIRTFHDAVLRNGSIPLRTLERIIDKYIVDNK